MSSRSRKARNTQADQPAGLTTDLDFPQTNDPTDLSTVFNPATAAGAGAEGHHRQAAGRSQHLAELGRRPGRLLGSPPRDPAGDQVHYDTTEPVTCPNASIIGTATADTPLLASRDPVDDAVTGPEPIHGDVFLIKPHPGDLSPSGDQDGTFRRPDPARAAPLRDQLQASRNRSRPNKTTGQLTATFTDNPQLPVSQLELNLKSGPRAPLATPTTCGTFTTTSRHGSLEHAGDARRDPLRELRRQLRPERDAPAPTARRRAPSARASTPAPNPPAPVSPAPSSCT